MTAEYVLDSWAVLALLGGEPAAPRVADLLDGTRTAMTWINLGEVASLLRRRVGAERAERAIEDVEARLWQIVPAGRDLTLTAATVKAEHPVSYADAFAAAAALQWAVPVVTGDPELLAADAPWRSVDLRGA